MSTLIPGRQSVLAALKNKRSLSKIYLAEGNLEGSAKQIMALAQEQKVPLQRVPRYKLQSLYNGNHQGVIAVGAPYSYATIDDMLSLAASRGEDPFLLMLAAIESPQNFGAVLRTADIAGVHGVIIAKHKSVGLNETVGKVAAGAAEHALVARVTNLVQTAQTLQANGLWVYGAATDGQLFWEQDLRGPLLLVIGGEDKGIPRLLGEQCDAQIRIPMVGHVPSLNASAAAAVMIYEVKRQRWEGSHARNPFD